MKKALLSLLLITGLAAPAASLAEDATTFHVIRGFAIAYLINSAIKNYYTTSNVQPGTTIATAIELGLFCLGLYQFNKPTLCPQHNSSCNLQTTYCTLLIAIPSIELAKKAKVFYDYIQEKKNNHKRSQQNSEASCVN